MAVLPAVVALGLMAYLPGRFLSRLLAPGGVEAPFSRLLIELLVGNAAVGLAGFALAELGIFSLSGVLLILAVVTGVAAYGSRSAAPGSYAPADAAGLAIALAVLVWVMPPFDTTLFGYDSSVYLASGRSLERHGWLAFVDPTVEEMPREQRENTFPSYSQEPGKPPFVRVAGGLLMQSLDAPVVLPAFHHLLSVWVGLARAIAGDDAATAPGPYFAALATWALVAFTWTMAGGTAAILALLLLALSAPQHWYSRFLMPEVPSQFFLWAALATAGASFAPRGTFLGAVAGLGLGMAGLMRLDSLGHTFAALALWKVFAPSRSWPAARGFLPALLLLSLYAAAHQVLFPTHYFTEIEALLRGGAAQLGAHWAHLAAAGTFAGVLALERRGGSRLASAGVRLGAAAFAAIYAAATLMTTRPDPETPLTWLVLYAGWPVLVGALPGAILWARQATRSSERFALLLGVVVLAQLLYDPRVTPAPLWAVRRFVPIVLPVILISAALLLERLGRGRRWVLVAGLGVLLAGTHSRNAFTYGEPAFRRSSEHVQALAALLPPDAIVIYDPRFATDSQFHIALWGESDIPAYLLAAEMRAPLLALRQTFRDRPLYWVAADVQADSKGIEEFADLVASYRFNVITRRIDWYDTREDRGSRDVTLWLYRLRPASTAPPLQ